MIERATAIPCANPLAQYQAHREEIDAALRAALDRGRYILGDEVEAFEQEFAAFIDVEHAIGVGSGTEALHVALKACGIGAGDEVITVAHTAVATVSAIELAGAVPVLVDIEPDTCTMDWTRLEGVITARTRAIIAVHLYGQPAHLAPLLDIARRYGLRLIEDCAQAHGATYQGRTVGSIGEVSCFSFYPTKNLGALGDGGLVATKDPGIARAARQLREYGWVERYVSAHVGWNSRLDELQAAVLRVKLRHLATDNARRVTLAHRYQAGLDGLEISTPGTRPESGHVFHLYVLRTPRRDALQRHLAVRGISTLVHYPVPVHLQPAYRDRLAGASALPETERAAREVLSLPMYPELSWEDVDSVVAAVREFAGPGGSAV